MPRASNEVRVVFSVLVGEYSITNAMSLCARRSIHYMNEKRLEMDVNQKCVTYFSCIDTPTAKHTQVPSCSRTVELAELQPSLEREPEQRDGARWRGTGGDTEPQTSFLNQAKLTPDYSKC